MKEQNRQDRKRGSFFESYHRVLLKTTLFELQLHRSVHGRYAFNSIFASSFIHGFEKLFRRATNERSLTCVEIQSEFLEIVAFSYTIYELAIQR